MKFIMKCTVKKIEEGVVKSQTDDLLELSLPSFLFSSDPQENDVIYVEVMTEKELQAKKDLHTKELLNELLDGN